MLKSLGKKMVARRVAAEAAMVTAMVGSWKEEGVK